MGANRPESLVNIYFDCLSVCLYSINVKMTELIGPKFCVGLHMTPGKVYGWSKFSKIRLQKIRFPLNFKNPRNFFFINPPTILFCFVLQCIQIKMFTIEIEYGCLEAPWKLSNAYLHMHDRFIDLNKIVSIFPKSKL